MKIPTAFRYNSFLFSCSSDSGFDNTNPFVPNYTFTVDINMNLPAYSNLQYASNAIYYPGVGARGIIFLIPVVAIML
jgi:hypothetical protein